MELRDHPLMPRKSGIKSWPPHWASTTADKSHWPKGEVGTLQQVWMHGTLDNCLFLFIEHEGHFYAGALYFDDTKFCQQLYDRLKTLLGQAIKQIGDLDLSYTL